MKATEGTGCSGLGPIKPLMWVVAILETPIAVGNSASGRSALDLGIRFLLEDAPHFIVGAFGAT